MTSLDDLERAVLGDARAFIEPKTSDEARVFSQLSAHLVLDGAATVSHVGNLNHGFTTRLRRILGTRKAVALSFALLGVGVGFGGGFVVGRRSDHAELAMPAAHVEAPAITPPALPVAAPERALVDTRSDESTRIERRNASGGPLSRQRNTASETKDGASELPEPDPIGEELALLKRAERAIRSNNALLALGLLRELDRQFPNGKLIEERTAARVMANCQQLEPAEARRMGEAYLQRAGSDVYHERVRRLCSLSEVSPNQKSEALEKASGSSGD